MKLTKWYYDLVSETGQAFIGYAVHLKVCHVTLPWRACFLWDDISPSARQGIGRFNALESPNNYSFNINHYQLAGQWQKSESTSPCHLIASDNLSVCWQGLSLNAPAKIMINNQSIQGQGYVERLEMTFKTAHLPFKQLQWGRFISHSGDKFLTWIKFDGKFATSQLFDGQRYYSSATISQDAVHYENGVLSMQLDKILLETKIATHVPYWLQRLLGGSIILGQENKWLSKATLTDNTGRLSQGWVIHEEVKW